MRLGGTVEAAESVVVAAAMALRSAAAVPPTKHVLQLRAGTVPAAPLVQQAASRPRMLAGAAAAVSHPC
jgi:hypothetical protein